MSFPKINISKTQNEAEKNWPLEDNILIFRQALVRMYLFLHLLMDNELVWLC